MIYFWPGERRATEPGCSFQNARGILVRGIYLCSVYEYEWTRSYFFRGVCHYCVED